MVEIKPIALSMREVQSVNKERMEIWHPAEGDSWTLGDWGNALAGEAGEACNVIKKLRRLDDGIVGNKADDADRVNLEFKLMDELADVLAYSFCIASRLGYDMQTAFVGKFNGVSEKNGFPQRLPTGASDFFK